MNISNPIQINNINPLKDITNDIPKSHDHHHQDTNPSKKNALLFLNSKSSKKLLKAMKVAQEEVKFFTKNYQLNTSSPIPYDPLTKPISSPTVWTAEVDSLQKPTNFSPTHRKATTFLPPEQQQQLLHLLLDSNSSSSLSSSSLSLLLAGKAKNQKEHNLGNTKGSQKKNKKIIQENNEEGI